MTRTTAVRHSRHPWVTGKEQEGRYHHNYRNIFHGLFFLMIVVARAAKSKAGDGIGCLETAPERVAHKGGIVFFVGGAKRTSRAREPFCGAILSVLPGNRSVKIGYPFPDQPVHIEQPETIPVRGAYRRQYCWCGVVVPTEDDCRETRISLHSFRCSGSRIFPFRFRRQPFPFPFGVRSSRKPRNVGDRTIGRSLGPGLEVAGPLPQVIFVGKKPRDL